MQHLDCISDDLWSHIHAITDYYDDPENREAWGDRSQWWFIKTNEELGEVAEALISWARANPRKLDQPQLGIEEVMKELADVAVTAMAALEHFSRKPESAGTGIESFHKRLDILCGRISYGEGNGPV